MNELQLRNVTQAHEYRQRRNQALKTLAWVITAPIWIPVAIVVVVITLIACVTMDFWPVLLFFFIMLMGLFLVSHPTILIWTVGGLFVVAVAGLVFIAIISQIGLMIAKRRPA